MKKYTYLVITKVPLEDENGNFNPGNLYNPILYTERTDGKWEMNPKKMKGKKIKNCDCGVSTPNFDIGEILIVDESGREITGKMRKPSKWYVETECFDSLEKAITRSLAI